MRVSTDLLLEMLCMEKTNAKIEGAAVNGVGVIELIINADFIPEITEGEKLPSVMVSVKSTYGICRLNDIQVNGKSVL